MSYFAGIGCLSCELAHSGYGRVSHLAGGMVDWQTSGYEVVDK